MGVFMQVNPGTIDLSVATGPQTGVTLDHCKRYTNWLTKAISWLFGRSVDVQYGDKVERVNIKDITSQIYQKVITATTTIRIPYQVQVENDLKELTSNCYEPLTREVLNAYTSRFVSTRENENDAVIVDVITALSDKMIQPNMKSRAVEEQTATLHCALKYVDSHRNTKWFARMKEAVEKIQPKMPNVQRYFVPPLFGRSAKQNLLLENASLINKILKSST